MSGQREQLAGHGLSFLYKTLLSEWFYYNVLRLSMTEECAWLIDRERFR